MLLAGRTGAGDVTSSFKTNFAGAELVGSSVWAICKCPRSKFGILFRNTSTPKKLLLEAALPSPRVHRTATTALCASKPRSTSWDFSFMEAPPKHRCFIRRKNSWKICWRNKFFIWTVFKCCAYTEYEVTFWIKNLFSEWLSTNSGLPWAIENADNHNTASRNQMSSSKNSLYSNFMETGITVLCKTGKNKIKKFNIKQGYCHNTRIWNYSSFPYRLLQVLLFLFPFDCAIHNFVSPKNMEQK